jgi:hypothetical protein
MSNAQHFKIEDHKPPQNEAEARQIIKDQRVESKKMNKALRSQRRGLTVESRPQQSKASQLMNRLVRGGSVRDPGQSQADLDAAAAAEKKIIPDGGAGAGAGTIESMKNKPKTMNTALAEIFELRRKLGGGDGLAGVRRGRK